MDCKRTEPGSETNEPCLAAEFPLLDYERAWRLQTRLVELRRRGRLARDVLLVLEHPPVVTAGKRGVGQDLLVPETSLAERGIALHRIERGGQLTYHGPGQLVVYPIFALRACRLRLTDFVHGLEEIMIRIAGDFGVRAERQENNRGVFVSGRKLGSLGLAVRRGVSFHGLALNVANDLDPFQLITPCGLAGTRMTSLAQEAEGRVSMAAARGYARYHVHSVFQRECRFVSSDWLTAFAELDYAPDQDAPTAAA